MDESTIAEMRARATAAKERIDTVEEGEVDEPEFDEVVTAAAMFANDAAKLAEDVDALTSEVERLTRERNTLKKSLEVAELVESNLHTIFDSARVPRCEAETTLRGRAQALVDILATAEAQRMTDADRARELGLHSEVERLTKISAVWESERRRIEGALDAAGLHDVEFTLTSRVERTCKEVVNGRQIDKQIQAFLDLRERDFDALRSVRLRPLVRIEKLADERDKLKAEVERLRASREEARLERDEFGCDVERLTEERNALNAKLITLEPLIEALHCADRQELPRDLADRVTAYVKALPTQAVMP